MRLFFLFLLTILINTSSCRLNLFRPFALTRQVKSTNELNEKQDASNNSKSTDRSSQKSEKMSIDHLSTDHLVNDQESNEKVEHLSFGRAISQTISRIVNEIEIELENQIENHISQSKDESLKNNTEHQTELPVANSNIKRFDVKSNGTDSNEESSPVRHGHATTMNSILTSELPGKKLNDSKLLTKPSRFLSSTSSTSIISSPAPDKLLSSSFSNQKLKNNSTELTIKSLSGLRSKFRTFGSIFDFIVKAFDEFAEALISRTATLIINSFFDKVAETFLGI